MVQIRQFFCWLYLVNIIQGTLQQEKPEVHFFQSKHKSPNSYGNITEAGAGPNNNAPTKLMNESNVIEHLAFSEVELERLCPPSNIEILKTIPSGIRCQEGNIDFWFKSCRCYYVKSLSCPLCPDSSQLAPLPIQRDHGIPHLTLSSPQQFNTSMIYQRVGGEEDNSTMEYATPNRFTIYNSAGGVVNLYFYNTGQQQVISSAVENELTSVSATNQSFASGNGI